MGWIEKLLSKTTVRAVSDIYPDFFSIERCENFHIHFRNIRQVFSEDEWEIYCKGVGVAYHKWVSQGKPSPIVEQEDGDPFKKNTKIPPNYLFQGKVNPVHDELSEELAVEKQIDQPYAKNMIHVHYKSLRMDLSVREFLEFVDEMTLAARELRTR